MVRVTSPAALLLLTLGVAGCRGAASDPPDRPEVTVATLNLMNQAADWPARRARLAWELGPLAADVIAFQEVLDVEGAVRQTDWLRSLPGTCRFDPMIVYEGKAPFGLAVVSRLPIVGGSAVELPSTEDDPRLLQRVLLETPTGPLLVANTHLSAGKDAAALRHAQAEAIAAALPRGGPTVLVGDFNAPWGAPELDPLRERFRDAWTAAGRDPSIPTRDPTNPLVASSGAAAARIDLVLVEGFDANPRAARRFADRPDDAGTWPSDHAGVAVRLVLPDVQSQIVIESPPEWE